MWHASCFNPLAMKKTLIILAIGSGLSLSQAQAEIESEFHVGYNSDYVFRGLNLGEDAYEYGLNFAGSSSSGLDWSAGLWGVSPSGGVTGETDVYASVSKDLGEVSVAAGFTTYTYEDGAAHDSELSLGISGEAYGLDVGATAFFGTEGAVDEQVLIEGSLAQSYELNDTTNLNAGLVIGYVSDAGLGGYATDNGVAYYAVTLSLDVTLSDDISLSPYVAYVNGDGGTIADVGSIEDGVIGGVKVSMSF